MITELFFDSLLNLGPDWKVEKIEYDAESDEVDIFVKWEGSFLLGANEKIYDYRSLRRWRHLDIMQYKTFISARIPRVIDSTGKVRSLEVPWSDSMERHTYLFERSVIDLLLACKNQTKVAQLMRCGFNVVNRIIHLCSERGVERRDKEKIYKQLSIDEKSFQKGHNYIGVLSSPDDGYIIDVCEGRKKADCTQMLEKNLSKEQRLEVENISMDMWKAFISSAKEVLPHTKIVHDRFHLIKYLNDAVDKVRQREVKNHEVLRNSKYALLKNHANLTLNQFWKFDEIVKINFEVSKAWRLKECFKALFKCDDYQQAFNRYSDWSSFCNWENIKEVNKVVDMFNRNLKGVCNALVEKLSNGMAERLNGKIQEIKIHAKGYRKFENFRSAILFFHGGLNLYSHK